MRVLRAETIVRKLLAFQKKNLARINTTLCYHCLATHASIEILCVFSDSHHS